MTKNSYNTVNLRHLNHVGACQHKKPPHNSHMAHIFCFLQVLSCQQLHIIHTIHTFLRGESYIETREFSHYEKHDYMCSTWSKNNNEKKHPYNPLYKYICGLCGLCGVLLYLVIFQRVIQTANYVDVCGFFQNCVGMLGRSLGEIGRCLVLVGVFAWKVLKKSKNARRAYLYNVLNIVRLGFVRVHTQKVRNRIAA